MMRVKYLYFQRNLVERCTGWPLTSIVAIPVVPGRI